MRDNVVLGIAKDMTVGWAVFRNYAGHAKEINGDVTDYPRFFLMPPTSVSYTHLTLPTIFAV